MQRRKLGSQGLEVSAQGLGCMGMTWAYGGGDEQSGLDTIHRALELGVTFLDTAEVYGPYTNERLVGRAVAGRRDQFEIATKFGFSFDPGNPYGPRGLDGSPENVKRACEGSLERLGTDYIDLFYQHRVDPAVPIEETVGALAELVKEGKVRYIGLSEASADVIRRAHATHPLTAVQSEYSLWTRSGRTSSSPTGCERWRMNSWSLLPSSRWRGCRRQGTTSCRSPVPSVRSGSPRTSPQLRSS